MQYTTTLASSSSHTNQQLIDPIIINRTPCPISINHQSIVQNFNEGDQHRLNFFLQYKPPKKIKRRLARFLRRVTGDVVTYTRSDRGTCYGWGWGFGPCAPSGHGTARGTATAGAGAAETETATATGRVASRAM